MTSTSGRVFRAIALVAAACAGACGLAEAAEPRPALAVARELVEAFNRRDPAAMGALVSNDFELFYFDEQGNPGRAVHGPEELRDEMIAYFAAHPSVRSEIVGTVDGPVFVSFREQIVGGKSSLAVYEVREGRIRRVWYFPAEPSS